jgi:GNAT superfamily N-acetyltransferase
VLGPTDVGHRVVVRRNAGVRGDRPVFTDLLGRLLHYGETHLTVRTRAGDVDVPLHEITHAKTVPDKRRLSATEALEVAAAYGWPAAEQSRLGDWWLRATAGWTMRGNSALPIGDPDRPLGEAIEAVTAWYRQRDLPPAISVPLPLRAGLDAELDRRDWQIKDATVVMTASLDELSLTRRSEPVHLDPQPSTEWLAVAASRKKSLPPAALDVLAGLSEVRFATVYGHQRAVLATARGVVADPERTWLGLSLIETAPEVRRQGYAQHIIGALVDWARPVGATNVYLQVLATNAAARALYERIGFRVHHSYVSRVLD